MSDGDSSLPVDTVDSELLKQELESRYAYYGYVPVILIIKAHGGRSVDENGKPILKKLDCHPGTNLNKVSLVPRACGNTTSPKFSSSLSNKLKTYIESKLIKDFSSVRELFLDIKNKEEMIKIFEDLFVKYYKKRFDTSENLTTYNRWQQLLLRANGIGEPLSEVEIEEYKSMKMSLFEYSSTCEMGASGLYDKFYFWRGANFDKSRADDSDYVAKQKMNNNIFVSFTVETQIVAAAREIKEKKISRKYDFNVYRQASKMLKEYDEIIPPRQGESFNWDELYGYKGIGWFYNLYVGYGYNDITIIDLSCDYQSCEGTACRGGRKARKSRKSRKSKRNKKSKKNKKNKRIK